MPALRCVATCSPLYLYLGGIFREHTEQRARMERTILSQDFCLIITIRDPEHRADVYDDITQGLDEYNFWHSNIKISSEISVPVDHLVSTRLPSLDASSPSGSSCWGSSSRHWTRLSSATLKRILLTATTVDANNFTPSRGVLRGLQSTPQLALPRIGQSKAVCR